MAWIPNSCTPPSLDNNQPTCQTCASTLRTPRQRGPLTCRKQPSDAKAPAHIAGSHARGAKNALAGQGWRWSRRRQSDNVRPKTRHVVLRDRLVCREQNPPVMPTVVVPAVFVEKAAEVEMSQTKISGLPTRQTASRTRARCQNNPWFGA
jgi:hypothetical protein